MALPRRRDRPAREAPSGTRSSWSLIALGIVALLVFVVATLPASLLGGRLERNGVTAMAFTGSIWSGAAVGLAWRGALLGDLRWRVAPLEMFRGRLGAHVTLTRPDGRIESDVAATLAGNLHLAGTRVDLPVEALGVLPVGLPKGWRGQLHADFAELELAKGWPAVVRGTIDMDGLVAPPPRNASIGSYHAVLPDPNSPTQSGCRHLGAGHGQGRPVRSGWPAHAVAGPQLPARRHARAARRHAARAATVAGTARDRRTRRDVASSA